MRLSTEKRVRLCFVILLGHSPPKKEISVSDSGHGHLSRPTPSHRQPYISTATTYDRNSCSPLPRAILFKYKFLNDTAIVSRIRHTPRLR